MKTKDHQTIATPPGCMRFNAFEVGTFEQTAPLPVDRDNNRISGLAVITIGEAKGHGLFVDEQFVNDVTTFGDMVERGFRSRWTHPGLSSDGMGKQLGRVSSLRREGDIVRGDLTILKAARNAPGLGNISEWLLDVADEDPSQFGASIVFSRDMESEQKFVEANSKDGKFVSPDPRNVRNMPHVRLSELEYVDMVERPAANPSGLFAAGSELPTAVERLLDYTFGIEEQEPDIGILGIHPERAKEFMSRYVASRGIGKEVSVSGLEKEQESEGVIMELQDGFTIDELFQAQPDLKDAIDGRVSEKTNADAVKLFGEILEKCKAICLSDPSNIDVVFESASKCVESGQSADILDQSIKAKLWEKSVQSGERANEGARGSLAANTGTDESTEYSSDEDELDKRTKAYAVAHAVDYSVAISHVARQMANEKKGGR